MPMPLLSFQVQIGSLHRPLVELEVWEPSSHQLLAVLSPAILSAILEHYFMQASLSQTLQGAIREQSRENQLLAKRWRRG